MKRSLLTEGHRVSISLSIEGANRHDLKLVRPTLESIVVERPEPCLLVRWDKKPQNYLAFLHFACGLIANLAAGLCA